MLLPIARDEQKRAPSPFDGLSNGIAPRAQKALSAVYRVDYESSSADDEIYRSGRYTRTGLGFTFTILIKWFSADWGRRSRMIFELGCGS